MKHTCVIKTIGLLSLLFLFSFSAFGQLITVQGTVTDANNEPLIGVNIKIVDTSAGTLSDLNGHYSLDIKSTDKLEFSYIGFKSQTIAPNGKTLLNVVLEEDIREMDELVVIGYGTSRKSDLTGSIATANLKDFEKSPNTNIVQSLQGAIPGLNIGQVNSAGATPTITVRGQNTISGNTGVLIVIDGMVSGNLSSINPADIESVNILKDASATAIYGAAASNGVMLITTKKGKAGKVRVDISTSYSTQSPTNNYTLMNSQQYMDNLKNVMWDKAYTEASGYTVADPTFDVRNYFPITTQLNPDGSITNTDTDWWSLATRPAYINENKISISGGTDAISYLVSYSNTNQENMLINDNFYRNTARVNLDAKIKKWWKMGLQTSASFVNQDGSEPILWTLYSMNPMVSPYNADGTLNPTPMETARDNPLMGNDTKDRERHTYFVGNIYSEFMLPLEGLTYRVNFGNNLVFNTHYQANP